jgi:hypothetical protein
VREGAVPILGSRVVPFAFRTRCCTGVAAGILRLSYDAGVLKAPPMLNRSILVRGAFIGLLLVGLVALADGIVRQQLQQAAGEMASLPTMEVAQTTGAIR